MSRGTAPRLGLRVRLALALVATGVATLLAATATMAPLIAHRLEADRLADLRGLARAFRPQLRALPDRDLRPHSRALARIAAQLQKRAGGRIAIFDAGGRVLADTGAATHEPILEDLDRQKRRAIASHGGVASGRHDGRAFAVTSAREERDRLVLVLTKRLDDTRAAAGVVRRALPLGLAAGLLVGAALALLLSRSVLRRLAELAGDARTLRDAGLSHPIRVHGSDEVAVVARTLEEVRARLVEEEASRQEFVATASHELRTPLASLQATLELLREEALTGHADPDHLAARTDTALRQTHRLVGLATDLLDLSRVDGQAELHREPLELAELARTVVPEFAHRLAAAGRALEVRGGPALALADQGATVRILRILLDNADNHGAGDVVVGVAIAPDAVTLSVADQGPGVTAADREAVFRRFSRGSAPPRTPGAGLGLAIARALAQAQDGTLELADGPGARFVLTLPPWRAGT